MDPSHHLLIAGACFACLLLAAALLWSQRPYQTRLALSWNQLVLLLAPLRLSVLPPAENLARMQANRIVINGIIASIEDWIPGTDYKLLDKLKQKRFHFQCALLFLRIVLSLGFSGLLFSTGFRFVVQTYLELVHELLAMHQKHHFARFRTLVIVLQC